MDIVIARVVGLLVIAILVAIAARRLALPYTVGLVVTGIVLALARVDAGLMLTHDFIFDVILPPLLFEASLSIHWHELRRDMVPVLVLSTLGVVVSAAVVAAGMTWLLRWPIAPALVFGVLIAATDPVAVIAMFKDIGIHGRLRLLVESESLFNDGVAAVLFGLVLSWTQAPDSTGGVGFAARTLASTAGGGIATGLVIGCAALLVGWRCNDRLVRAAITLAAAYGSFLLAESVHFSGVLATVCAGLAMGNIGTRDMSRSDIPAHEAREFVIAFWEFAAFIANSLIFLLIGLTAARIPFAQFGVVPLLIAIALVLLGRALTVYPLCLPFFRSRWAISPGEQHVLWWGGLRGALALALTLALPAAMPLHDEIQIATFGVVVFSVIVQGLTMTMMLRRLGFLPRTEKRNPA